MDKSILLYELNETLKNPSLKLLEVLNRNNILYIIKYDENHISIKTKSNLTNLKKDILESLVCKNTKSTITENKITIKLANTEKPDKFKKSNLDQEVVNDCNCNEDIDGLMPITYVKTDNLYDSHHDHPRIKQINNDDLDEMLESIINGQLNDPIVIDKDHDPDLYEDGLVLDGYKRLKLYYDNNIEEIPVVYCTKSVVDESQYHYPTKRMIEKQSAWRGSAGITRSFGGVEKYNNKSKKSIDERIEDRIGIRIVEPDIIGIVNGPQEEELIQLLNKARAEEVIAYLQYEAQSILVPSLFMPGLEDVFYEHATEELDHSRKLAKRLHELGCNSIVYDPIEIGNLSDISMNIGSNVKEMIISNVKSEEAAITRYKQILELCDSDSTTRRVIEDILADEEHHLTELKNLLETSV